MIYTDNGATFVSVTGNVMSQPNFDNWGSRHKDYRSDSAGTSNDPTLIADNYWQQGDPDSSQLGVTVRGNRLIASLDQVPASVRENAGLEARYRSLLGRQLDAGSAPEPPSRVAVFAGGGLAYVSWNPPVFEGGSPVRSYTVTSSMGDRITISADDFRAAAYVRVSGLSNGEQYTFTVTATNGSGTSQPSLPSLPVTLTAAAVRAPDAPQSVSVLPGRGMASIHFQAPTVVIAPSTTPAGSDGGSPIISYTITANPGGRKVTVTGRDVLVLGSHTTFAVIDGLQAGTSYTFTITADNVAGSGTPRVTSPVTVT